MFEGEKTIHVQFYETIKDELLEFAVILTKFEEKWVFCKHRERGTWEFPVGHRDASDTVEQAARCEIYEETGVVVYTM